MKRYASQAASYVRMSTESQDYSTDHQRAALAAYASSRSLDIVREYVDDGKSGLDIKRRAGLLNLMRDVQSGSAEYSFIIVYDVSRWGRFQDIDEAAYHEHTCRRAGIQVIYCAERFVDDGTPYSALLKGMKRVMAAEYSRDLSEKVFLAQCRFIEKGFKPGGHAGYGLRRLAITAQGRARTTLEYGEAKRSITDRVILTLGPASEVATVQRVYKLYIDERLSETAIARLLNQEEIPSEFGRPWTQAMVNSLLSNIKYCGTLAYNRRSSKLSSPRHCNSSSDWIIKSNAFDSIVSSERFEEARLERLRRKRRYSSEELLKLLRQCHQTHGKVTARVIATDASMPDPQLFVRAFGSLVRAYDAAGLPRLRLHAHVETKRALLAKQLYMLSDVKELAHRAGATVESSAQSSVLVLNGKVRLRVETAVCRHPKRGAPKWCVAPRKGVDFIITARIDPVSGMPLDYFLISSADLVNGPIYLKESNLSRYQSSRFSSMSSMFFA